MAASGFNGFCRPTLSASPTFVVGRFGEGCHWIMVMRVNHGRRISNGPLHLPLMVLLPETKAAEEEESGVDDEAEEAGSPAVVACVPESQAPSRPAAPKSSIIKSPHIPSIRSGSVSAIVGSAIDPSSSPLSSHPLASPLSLLLPATPSSSAGLQGDAIVIVAGRAVQVACRLHRRQHHRRPIIFITGRLPASDLPFFIVVVVDSSQALIDCSALLYLRRPLQAGSALSSSSQASLPCLAPLIYRLIKIIRYICNSNSPPLEEDWKHARVLCDFLANFLQATEILSGTRKLMMLHQVTALYLLFHQNRNILEGQEVCHVGRVDIVMLRLRRIRVSCARVATLMGGLDRSIQCLLLSWLRQMTWGRIDGRMMPSEKTVGAATAVINGLDDALVGIENGGRLKAREATSPATEGMELSQLTTVCNDSLRP
ncbi:hypothetical protein ACLOJK_040736 [Asimina triloba]